MFTYSNGYWELYRRFQEDFLGSGGIEGKGLRGRMFLWNNLSWGKIISMKGVQDLLVLFKTKTMKK